MCKRERNDEMRQVLKSLIEINPNNDNRIITDNGGACVSQRMKVNAFMNMYMPVSSLKHTKEDRVVKRTPNRAPWSLELSDGTCPGITSSEVRAVRSNLDLSKAAGQSKIHRDSFVTWSPRRQRFCDNPSTNPGC